ncbi:MAG: MFS transporter [Candidatus Hydrogenedentes bacterium]|nr:MFS transporter [Candidatus Hydrogenedentota bacterium]
MKRPLKYRLSIMMFLEYLVPGATVPILSLYLKDYLDFESYRAGIIMAMPALAAVFAPLAASHIADRFVSAERLLALCHMACGIFMIILTRVETFPVFVLVYTAYGVCFTPTLGLTNTVALHHIKDARRDFTGIRMWGTVGWVAVGWAFGYFWMRGGAPGARLPHALPVSALASLVLAGYALTFKPAPHGGACAYKAPYSDVIRLFLRRDMMLLCLLTFLNSACHQFYYFGMSPFMRQSGFSTDSIMPAMSIGQAAEVVVLAVMGWFLMRISIKAAMLIGVLAQGLRMVMFAFAGSHAIVMGGIVLHGFCFAFFFISAYLYVESHSSHSTRAGAQQVLTIMIAGIGTLAGFLGAGYTAQWLTDSATGLVDYRMFWLVPAGLCAVVTCWLAVGFHELPVKEGD